MPFDPTSDDLAEVERWHFAVGGLDTREGVLPIGGPLSLRRLASYPTHETLAARLRNLPVAGAMAQHGDGFVGHVVVVDASRFEDRPDRLFPTVAAVLAGLRIRTGAEIVCPAVCERPWDDLASGPAAGLRAYHVERGYAPSAAAAAFRVLPDDIAWLRDHLGRIVLLLDDEKFATAVEALCTHMLAANDRMRAAQLWAGIEALLTKGAGEIGYRLRVLTAVLTEERGPARRECYRRVKHPSNIRSKIVHGDKVKPDEFAKHPAKNQAPFDRPETSEGRKEGCRVGGSRVGGTGSPGSWFRCRKTYSAAFIHFSLRDGMTA